MENLFRELEDRRSAVEKYDFDSETRNREHQRSFWLHMIILSSAIVIGILPIIGQVSSPIKSPILAKIGLLIIILTCVLIIFYLSSVLSREKVVLFDLKTFHASLFLRQRNILNKMKSEKRSMLEIENIFRKSKITSSDEEEKILTRHLIQKRFISLHLFIDKHFNRIISFGFLFGVVLIVLSFLEAKK